MRTVTACGLLCRLQGDGPDRYYHLQLQVGKERPGEEGSGTQGEPGAGVLTPKPAHSHPTALLLLPTKVLESWMFSAAPFRPVGRIICSVLFPN